MLGLISRFLFVAIIVFSAIVTNADTKQITESGITVYYPSNMETQAKQLMKIAKENILPGLEVHKQIIVLLSNIEKISSDIVGLLGVKEKQVVITERLLSYKRKSEALEKSFTNLKLISRADAIAKEGVDAGVLQMRYIKAEDEFDLKLDLDKVDQDRLRRSYFPVFYDKNGSIRNVNTLGSSISGILGSNKMMAVAVIHDTVGYAIADELKLYHPFARWFNEGVAGWVTKKVIASNYPKLNPIVDMIIELNPKSKELRDKINLQAWPQAPFQNRRSSNFDPQLEAASVQYSVELITKLLGTNPDNLLGRIISEIRYLNPDTDTIIAAISKVTKKDFKPVFLAYVPDWAQGESSLIESQQLLKQAEELAMQKNWKESVNKLTRALQITPLDMNARLNLAWIEREAGDRADSEFQVFLAARLAPTGKQNIHLYGKGAERDYVMGRMAILLGDLSFARAFMMSALEQNPGHSDAKRAIEEIKAIESSIPKPN